MSAPQDSPARIVWSCRVDSLGRPAVMVNYAERTALSTLGGAVATVVVAGDVATWQENDADGVGYRLAVNRSTRELQVTMLSGRHKGAVRRGVCAPPAAKPRRGRLVAPRLASSRVVSLGRSVARS